uniref:Uncharacterized protein n=1 Tax=Knipowitschia caucasica TaxID=637954 RepID=A0AAV2ME81_KNICA
MQSGASLMAEDGHKAQTSAEIWGRELINADKSVPWRALHHCDVWLPDPAWSGGRIVEVYESFDTTDSSLCEWSSPTVALYPLSGCNAFMHTAHCQPQSPRAMSEGAHTVPAQK